MESHSLLASNNVKVEPASETDCVHGSAKEIPTEIFDKMDSQITASVKVEQPEVYVDYPGQEMHPSSESYPSFSTQERSQTEMYGNTNVVKQEDSSVLCQDTGHMFSKVADKERRDTIQDIAEHSDIESRMTDNNEKVPLNHENYCEVSEDVSSDIEISKKLSLINETRQLQSVETSVKHTQISTNSLDYIVGYTSCSPERIQTQVTPYVSDVCNPVVNVERYLNRQNSTYTEQQLYDCDESSTEPCSMKLHKRKQTCEKTYWCEDCGAYFAQASSLKCHKRIHTGEKPYTCDDCGASFTEIGKLKSHKRRHTGEKPYKCDDCGASFGESGNLKYHKRTHTGEKPYKCDDCGVSFTQAGSLNRHKRIHTGEKPFMCDDCGSSFNLAGNLKRHKRTHTGEKPYKCDVCGVSFTEASKMRSHKRRHTGEKPYKSDNSSAFLNFAGYLKHQKRKYTDDTP